MIGYDYGDTIMHNPEFTRYGTTPQADRAVLDGGLAMAWTAIDLATTLGAAVRTAPCAGPGGSEDGAPARLPRARVRSRRPEPCPAWPVAPRREPRLSRLTTADPPTAPPGARPGP